MVVLIEVWYFLSGIFFYEEYSALLGVCIGSGVILSFISDLLMLGALLCVLPFINVYMSFLLSYENIGIVMNETKKIVLIVLINSVFPLMILLFMWWVPGFVSTLVVGSYVLYNSTVIWSVYIFGSIYLFLISGWRIFALGLLPMPLFFLKLGLPMIFLYMVLLFSYITWH